jgi:hypothetical protein
MKKLSIEEEEYRRELTRRKIKNLAVNWSNAIEGNKGRKLL